MKAGIQCKSEGLRARQHPARPPGHDPCVELPSPGNQAALPASSHHEKEDYHGSTVQVRGKYHSGL